MKTLILVAAIIFSSIYVFSADSEKVKTKAKETWEAGKDYTYEQKEDFAKSIREQIKKLDAQMHKVNSASEEELAQIKTQKQKLYTKLNEISASSESAWGELKNGINSAFDDLKTSVNKAKDKFK